MSLHQCDTQHFFLSSLVQFVQPAYITMLGHLRSRTLEKFKNELEQSLNRGEGFAASVRKCSQSSMLEFDRGCAGKSTYPQAHLYIVSQVFYGCPYFLHVLL